MGKELKIKDIIDSNSEKIAIIIGLGPCLSENLKDFKKINNNPDYKDKVKFFVCNAFDKMIDINPDYWLISAPIPELRINQYYKRYNAKKGVTLFFNTRFKGYNVASANKLLEIDYVPQAIFSNEFKEYTKAETTYGGVETVLIHLMALSVIIGCKKSYISGANLDYSKGYIKNGVWPWGEIHGKSCMTPAAQKRTVNFAKIINSNAKTVNCNIYTLNKASPLSSVLEVKTIEDVYSDLSEKWYI